MADISCKSEYTRYISKGGSYGVDSLDHSRGYRGVDCFKNYEN